MSVPISLPALPELTRRPISLATRVTSSFPRSASRASRSSRLRACSASGAGGLGSPLALYLAAAGIGTLGLVDFDVVDASNLQRQIIHSTRDIGRKKLDSAAEKLLRSIPRSTLSSTRPCSPAPTPSTSSRTTTSSPTAPTTSPRATWSTMPACCWASRMSTDRSSGLRARPASSPPRGSLLSLPLS